MTFADWGAAQMRMRGNRAGQGWQWHDGRAWKNPARDGLPAGFTQADADALRAEIRRRGLSPSPLAAPRGTSSRPQDPGARTRGVGGVRDRPSRGTGGSGGRAGDDTLASTGLFGGGNDRTPGPPSSETDPDPKPDPKPDGKPDGKPAVMPWDPGAKPEDIPDFLRDVPYTGLILLGDDPVYDVLRAGENQGKDYDDLKSALGDRFKPGSPLSRDDPWLHTIQVGGKAIDFYDRGSRYGGDNDWVWWKEGVGWVSLTQEAPPGFSKDLQDLYTTVQSKPLDPIVDRPVTGPNGQKGTQNLFGGGWIGPDGSRMLTGGHDTYPDGTEVFYDGMIYSPDLKRWTFVNLRGKTAAGKAWRADHAWYENGRPVFQTRGKPGFEWLPTQETPTTGGDPTKPPGGAPLPGKQANAPPLGDRGLTTGKG